MGFGGKLNDAPNPLAPADTLIVAVQSVRIAQEFTATPAPAAQVTLPPALAVPEPEKGDQLIACCSKMFDTVDDCSNGPAFVNAAEQDTEQALPAAPE